MLSRIVSVVRFLSSRGLPFQGDNERIASTSNGLYLGCLELISEYDPFLSQHLSKYANKGSGHVSYLSAHSRDEFIHIMASCVLETISQEVKDAKYYSLIVDSTPDCSHTDQLAVVLRYVSLMEAEPKERLFKLLPRVRHSSEQLEEALLKCLTELGLEIKNCMGAKLRQRI